MNRNDLFSAIEYIDDRIIENSEVKRTMNNRRSFGKKTLMLVAVLCLLTAFATAAFATNLFGIRDALIKTDDPEIKSAITLSGFSDSNEYKAVAEWNEFAASYDLDGMVEADLDKKYDHYPVYTQEMADKLDEIVAKYGLSLHSGFREVTFEEWDTVVGEVVVNDYEEFSDNAYNTIISGYIFDDGTCRYDGIFTASKGRMNIDYQFSRVAKGTFDTVFINIGDVDEYQEEMIVTDSGVELTAAMSEDKSLIIAELDRCFVVVNVLEGSNAGITIDDLKDLANTFDFAEVDCIKSKPAEDNQEVEDNRPMQDVDEYADSEIEWDTDYIEYSPEYDVVEKVPVEICRVVDFDTTIATAPEYFTHSVCEGIDTFSYDAWEGTADVYYSVYADNVHTSEELAGLFERYDSESYNSVMIEENKVGDYDAVIVYCNGNKHIPDYNKHYYIVPCNDGCIVIETQFCNEMYEGLYPLMCTLINTLTIG